MCEIIHCRGAYYAPAGEYYSPLRNPCQQKHTFFETRHLNALKRKNDKTSETPEIRIK